MSNRRRENQLLNTNPADLTDEELEEALGDGVRMVRLLGADSASAGSLRQVLGARHDALRAKVKEMRAELRRRG